MTLRLLSWNVRGHNNPRKREVCKNLLKEWKCNTVCFQETKVSTIDCAFVRSLWGSPFTDWTVLDAMQSSGGVLLIWDKRVFEKLDVIALVLLIELSNGGRVIVLRVLQVSSLLKN